MMFLDNERVKMAKKMGIGVFKCPVTGGNIMESSRDDDKVLCSCGKPNPSAPEGIQEVERRTHTHVVAYLQRVC